LEQKLIVNATGPATVRLLPPLIVGESEIDLALERLGGALAAAGEGG
jgi:acetylornithine/succinyldiaminopimelate/putrescine aminotransferase